MGESPKEDPMTNPDPRAMDAQATAIATALGADWRLLPPTDAERAQWPSRDLHHVDGYGVQLRWDKGYGHTTPRLTVSGRWPQAVADGRHTPSSHDYTRTGCPSSISVDPGKLPHVIARDIQRRLVDHGYRDLWAEKCAQVADADAYTAATLVTVRELAAVGGRVGSHGAETVYFDRITVRAQGPAVRFEYFTVSRVTARAILALIAADETA
jgi:hypothetical protein